MKNVKKTKLFVEAAVVLTIALALVMPSSAVVTNTVQNTNSNVAYATLINKAMSTPGLLTLGTDVLVSLDNPDQDDMHPRIAVNGAQKIVVTYEKEESSMSVPMAIVFSDDDGATWTLAYSINTLEFTTPGSGVAQRPDLKYNAQTDEFFWVCVDDLADQPFEPMVRIPSEFPSELLIQGISGNGFTSYDEGIVGMVGPWFLGGGIIDFSPYTQIPSIGYYDAEWNNPPTLPQQSLYFDGQSIMETSMASNFEITTGLNRIYIVMERFNDTTGQSEIALKATVTDLDPASPEFLFTAGGGPGGMDKFADIEVWPKKQTYVAREGSQDPDIAAKGSRVAVVYSQSGDVKCVASVNDGDDFTISSTVATGAGYPSVYVTADKVYCAYVKDNNVYLVSSDDNGATWGTPTQLNDQAGSVVAEEASVEIGALGVVWTDNRNTKKDIYFEFVAIEVPVQYPDFDITIAGGLGVSATVTNTGDVTATNALVTLKVTGGILGRINASAEETFATIGVGEAQTVKTGILFGLGAISIKATVTCDEFIAAGLPPVKQTAAGTQFIIFSIVK